MKEYLSMLFPKCEWNKFGRIQRWYFLGGKTGCMGDRSGKEIFIISILVPFEFWAICNLNIKIFKLMYVLNILHLVTIHKHMLGISYRYKGQICGVYPKHI
jgi:hypothetical protein